MRRSEKIRRKQSMNAMRSQRAMAKEKAGRITGNNHVVFTSNKQEKIKSLIAKYKALN
jgi:hypothetical protein